MAEGGHCVRSDQTYSTDDWLTGCLSNTLLFGNIITSAPNDRVLHTTQVAKLSFNHPSVVLTADVLLFFFARYHHQAIFSYWWGKTPKLQ